MAAAISVPVDNGRGDIFVSICIESNYNQPTYPALSPPPFQTVSHLIFSSIQSKNGNKRIKHFFLDLWRYGWRQEIERPRFWRLLCSRWNGDAVYFIRAKSRKWDEQTKIQKVTRHHDTTEILQVTWTQTEKVRSRLNIIMESAQIIAFYWCIWRKNWWNCDRFKLKYD